jgi:hypothetical protein
MDVMDFDINEEDDLSTALGTESLAAGDMVPEGFDNTPRTRGIPEQLIQRLWGIEVGASSGWLRWLKTDWSCFAERLACKLSLFWYRLGGPPGRWLSALPKGLYRPKLRQDFQQVNLPTFLLNLAPNCLCKYVLIRHGRRVKPGLRRELILNLALYRFSTIIINNPATPAACCAYSIALTVVTAIAVYLIGLWPILLQYGLFVRPPLPELPLGPVQGSGKLHSQ